VPRIVTLAGDGIGPEVMEQAERVLRALPLGLELDPRPFGGGAIRTLGAALPDETLAAAKSADAVLLAAIGLPEFDGKPVRPEQGLLKIRQELGVFANLRPAKAGAIDLLIVRELIGGIYFGKHGRHPDGRAYDTLEYSADEIERVARTAFELARTRRRQLVSVDKANVLETSRLWREVVSELGKDYPDVALTHMYVDNCALQIVLDATQFDVLLTENMMGDILSDEVAGFCGGLGLAASASIGAPGTPGIFEPVHGSAPDIAGKGLANPAAMLLTTSLLLAYGLGEHAWAAKLDAAVAQALLSVQTPDQGGTASTADVGDAVLAALGL
jgi:3-isopropylmalate dehydrogenase